MFRSKKTNQHIKEADLFLNNSNKSICLFEKPIHSTCYVSSSLWDDLPIDEWIQQQTSLSPIQQFFKTTLNSPIYDKDILIQRQRVYSYFQNHSMKLLFTSTDVSYWDWLLSLNSHLKNYLLDRLYPPSYPMKALTLHPLALNSYQLYQAYVSPLVQCMYPLSILMGPYFYVRKTFQWKLSLKDYFQLILQGLKWLYHNVKMELKSVLVMGVYLGIYVYSLILSIDLSNQLRRYRHQILQRLSLIRQKIRLFQSGLKRIPIDFWKSFGVSVERSTLLKPVHLSFYTLWKYPESRESLKDMYKVMAIYDGMIQLSSLRQGWNLCSYSNKPTYMIQMKHPMMINPTPNPIYFKKHLILTGPNAGGKTTYVKTFLWNSLFGQSFGIVRAKGSNIHLVDALLHHDRVKDCIGTKSLFEAEMEKAKEVLTISQRYQHPIYFMDEPFHSTPPMDGAAMLKALMVYLAKETNCQLILTTHYFSVQDLENEYPTLFKNISVEGFRSRKDSGEGFLQRKMDSEEGFINSSGEGLSIYQFTYRIRKGPSKQSIGIELLKQQDFPEKLIETAIKMKNKIYQGYVNV